MRLKIKSMSNHHILPICILIAALASSLTACNNSGCNDNRSSIPKAVFYSSEGSTISLDSIDVGGLFAPNDSLLLCSGTAASSLYLPLRSTATSTAFYINYRYAALDSLGLSDTIYIDYTSTPYFASEECGAMYKYHITRLSYTTTILDKVVIVATDSVIDNSPTESLQLYFRTSSSEQ